MPAIIHLAAELIFWCWPIGALLWGQSIYRRKQIGLREMAALVAFVAAVLTAGLIRFSG
jgi:hypothetical protein